MFEQNMENQNCYFLVCFVLTLFKPFNFHTDLHHFFHISNVFHHTYPFLYTLQHNLQQLLNPYLFSHPNLFLSRSHRNVPCVTRCTLRCRSTDQLPRLSRLLLYLGIRIRIRIMHFWFKKIVIVNKSRDIVNNESVGYTDK